MTLPGARQISIGHVIERTASTFAAIVHPLLLPVLLLVGGTSFAAQYLSGYDPTDPAALLSSPAYWLAVLVGASVGIFGQAVIIGAALDHLFQRPLDVRARFATALDQLLPVLGLSFLSFLLMLTGFVLLVVPGIIVALALTVGLPAMLEEDLGVADSIRRSRALTRGDRWRILALIVIGTMIYGGVGALLGAPLAIAGQEGGVPRPMLLAIDAFVGTFGALLIGAFTAALYVDLRIAKEGPASERLSGIFE